MTRAVGVGAAALAGLVAAAWVLWPAPPPRRAAPAPVPVDIPRALRAEGAALDPPVQQALSGPAGPAVDAELRRIALARTLADADQAADPTFPVSFLGEPDGRWGALDPGAPAGDPRQDGNAALRSLAPIGGPLLVEAAPAAQLELLSACVIRGAWCLVVDSRPAALAAWDAARDAARAADLVDRAGRDLPADAVARWLAPDGAERVRLAKRR